MNKVKRNHDVLLARAEELVDEARELTHEMRQLLARRSEIAMRFERGPASTGGGAAMIHPRRKREGGL